MSAALLPFAIVFYLVAPEARKRLLRDLITLLVTLLLVTLLWRGRPALAPIIDDLQRPQAAPEDLLPAPDVAAAPEPQPWFVLFLTIGIAVFLAAVVVGLGWVIFRRRERSATPLDRLAQQAEEAIDTLEAGGDLKDTVTRCYLEMMQVLKEERGIQRQRAMTPREFEARLEEVGIPTHQVRRLTRLFEQVRYGDKRLGQQEERQAIISLSSIVRFCRSAS